MNRNDLRKIDINLLIVFETLMFDPSLTRAAQKLYLGQPAISAALRRLREYFDDPLFVRTGRLMEPTARANELLAKISPVLDSLSSAIGEGTPFTPSLTDKTFRIGLSDDVEYALLPKVLRQIRAEAPRMKLVIRRANVWQITSLLSSGEISMGISFTQDLPANAKRRKIRRMHPTVICADNSKSDMSLDEFCSRPHVLVSYSGDMHGFVDESLLQLDRVRTVVLAIPQFNSLPSLLLDTELISIVPDYVAEAMSARTGLKAMALPFDHPGMDLSMAWHGTHDNDPAEQWLRSRFFQLLREEEPA